MRPPALATLLLVVAAGCYRGPVRAPDPYREELEAMEASLAELPIRYATYGPRADGRFRPVGLYRDGESVWVFAHEQPVQRELRRGADGWEPGAERRGPLGTRRCLAGYGAFDGRTICAGSQEPGGLRVVAGPDLAFALPAVKGYRDVAQPTGVELVVLGGDRDRLTLVGADGAVLGEHAVPSASDRVVAIGEGAVAVLSGTAPYLSTFAVGDGLHPRLERTDRVAPFRAAAYDAAADRLWLCGPEDRPVRRHRGPIEQLGATVVALDGAALRRGELVARVEVALAPLGLVDATAIDAASGVAVVSASGSDRIAVIDLRCDDVVCARTRALMAPAAPAAVLLLSGPGSRDRPPPLDGEILVASPLDEQVSTAALAGTEARIAHSFDHPGEGLVALGERLFYGAYLWRQEASAAFTCNSCHWDGGTDHRVQPGFLERRREVTRPLGGIAAIRPIFTTGGASSLTRALEGLVRGLDHRMWNDAPERRYWDYPIRVRERGATRTLTARDARAALLAFLMDRPVVPGPLRDVELPAVATARRRGLLLFDRDCIRCHEARPATRSRERVAPDRILAVLGRRPLAFGAPGYAPGPGPDFTPNGNRISPLLELGRGGPFFSSGAAPDLDALLRAFDADAPRVHRGRARYAEEERDALRTFLLSL